MPTSVAPLVPGKWYVSKSAASGSPLRRLGPYDTRREADDVAAGRFTALATSAKALLLKLARSAATGRPLDSSSLIEQMASDWDAALDRLTP